MDSDNDDDTDDETDRAVWEGIATTTAAAADSIASTGSTAVITRYNGEQLLAAMTRAPFMVVYVLNLIAQTNPFILSYVGSDPDRACKYLEEILH